MKRKQARLDPHPPRVVIENVRPQIAEGRFAIKRTPGEAVEVTADIHLDGHEELRAVLLHRREGQPAWSETPMQPRGNDTFQASFPIVCLEPHRYTVEAWADPFRSWRRDLGKRVAAGSQTEVDLAVGAALIAEAAQRAPRAESRKLAAAASGLVDANADLATRCERALDERLLELMDRHPERRAAARPERELPVFVDRPRARFSAWYEFFPRSARTPGRHGSFRDAEERLAYVAEMGFDVCYLPPIHPIGRVNRKGRNNSTLAGPDDPGSPWAIGSSEGGHTAIHPQLGTLDDFRRLLARARELGLEIALDLAFQCAPDHPWVEEHPAWFTRRPDGSVQHAENPPKKYEDIYPLDFESEDWRGLWNALRDVVLFWVAHGVQIFRVDNPHTKPYAFWEWLIAEVRREHPEVFFLAEAFTRPKVMQRLARLGFSQSYNYFAWRNTKAELTDYLTELTTTEIAEYLRPNLWPNTPDILPEPLQYGGPPAFAARLLLAATLGASYGIYGPAYELCEGRARKPGGEEYLDSEKYELRHWQLDSPHSLRDLIARVNRIRRENPALQSNQGLRFHEIDNERLIAYSKTSADREQAMLMVVNLDPHHVQAGWLELDAPELGLEPGEAFQAHDLLADARYFWSGRRHYVELDPGAQPGHVFRLRRRLRSERDFDYYL